MQNPRNPLVSCIISTKNESATLSLLLRSINRQTYSPNEVIVVDNHSSDDTLKIAKHYTSYIYTKGRERSEQRNFGVKKARGRYILFLDADMELSPSIVNDCVEAVRTKNAVGIIIPEDVRVSNFFSRMKRLEKRMYWNEPLIEAARFFKKRVFAKVGGYNEQLIAGEDWDLARRVSQEGSVARIDTPLYHHELSAFRELRHKMYYTRHISSYQHVYPIQFREQSGMARVHLFLRKGNFFNEDPLAFIGLMLFKGLEFLLYRSLLIYNDLHQSRHLK